MEIIIIGLLIFAAIVFYLIREHQHVTPIEQTAPYKVEPPVFEELESVSALTHPAKPKRKPRAVPAKQVAAIKAKPVEQVTVTKAKSKTSATKPKPPTKATKPSTKAKPVSRTSK